MPHEPMPHEPMPHEPMPHEPVGGTPNPDPELAPEPPGDADKAVPTPHELGDENAQPG